MSELEEEVAEPDLSMELLGQLQQTCAEFENLCLEEVQALQAASLDLPPVQKAEAIDSIWVKYAHAAVTHMVCLLQSFNPEISKANLSSDIHSIIHSGAVVSHIGKPMTAALRDYVPCDRSEWLGRDIDRHLEVKEARRNALWRKAVRSITAYADKVGKESPARVVIVAAGSGVAVMGTAGGALGLLGGAVTGAVVGTVPAPLTFGLSIPVAAVAGGSMGACGGAALGSTAGLAIGGTAGSVLLHRDEVQEGAKDVAALIVRKSQEVCRRASDAARVASKDEFVRTTAASAAGAASGASIAGVGGGAFGLASGSAFGAASGLVAAPLTFGLSIPVGAIVGGSTGLFAGATIAGTTGLVTGGIVGNVAYAKRSEIKESASNAWAQVSSLADSVKQRANYSAFVGGTGGTA
eukprot:TRINITY_DN7281_c0_g1_i3.p1 TRINITY_DN7281_c0_g1~~TRINITY_DN7281_c0_g1_i3.p1  ORF type:complete len:422 (-),score=95.52 TRINITY_DN7281_c0_g1_i3:490-1716(-)